VIRAQEALERKRVDFESSLMKLEEAIRNAQEN
jgi:hypothetical protein